MLRTLGSTLLAKSQPGSALRKQEELAAERPDIPGKGQTGTLSRSLIEEPLVRQVPPGSQKIVSVQPTIEGTTVNPNQIVPPQTPLTEAVGLPSAMPVRPRAAAQPLLQEMGQGGAPVRPGVAPTAVSGGAIAGAKPAITSAPAIDGRRVVSAQTPVPVQGVASLRSFEQNAPTAGNFGGGAIILGPGGGQVSQMPFPVPTMTPPNATPTPAPIQVLRSQPIQPMQSKITGAPVKSVQNTANVLRTLAGGAGQGVQKVTNFLRSLFKR